ncbi:class I SAM-dependent methyltransferase [Fundidesulfovibrio agrisoli]|uniref:class I SAM-dependent methyltransferase n=1 Tax=Fundidesulfovibrio agrisoli TaxID=2922717 RepID=UPI001FADCB6C|nr:class I SAM-dependent methyltransferase [Fundidesulfovibrio agrisoli]
MPFQANADRFLGLGQVYDAHRPAMPVAVADLLCRYTRVKRPALVADLGSGTGLSSRVWIGRADRIVGIEPNPDMRRQAAAALPDLPCDSEVEFREGHSWATGLEDGSVDIVTCSQSLHWMEPEPTFAEAARILRPGGVFASVDYDQPPSFDWEVEAAYQEMTRRVKDFESRPEYSRAVRWAKSGHLERIAQSGRFRFTREVVLHGMERGGAARVEGLARSLGGVSTLLAAGLSEEALGLAELIDTAKRVLGANVIPWLVGYRIRLGIK